MSVIYVPCHTHCSDCGRYAGATPLGVAFHTREEAAAYLASNPNPCQGWGDGVEVMTIQLIGREVAPEVYGPHCGYCGQCEYCAYGQG